MSEQEIEQEEEQEQEAAELTPEERAEAIGWKEGGAKSAEEFLDARNNHLGAANADIRKLEQRLSENNATITAMAKHLEAREKKGIQQGYANAIRDAKSTMRQASEEGDVDKFDQASRNVDALVVDRDKKLDELEPIAQQPEQGGSNGYADQINQHVSENPQIFATENQTSQWGKELAFFAGKGNSYEESVAKADQAVIKQFKLGKQMPGPSGDNSSGSGGGSVEFSQLPKEDREAYQRFAKEMPGYTKKEYMEAYNAQ